ncbi:MAG: phosphatidate cytidylyltransferase [Actinomycetota bacterium]
MEQSTDEPRGRSLRAAVGTSVALLVIVIICALVGEVAFFVLIVALCSAALYELFTGLTQAGRRPLVPFALLAAIAMMTVAFFESFRLLGVVVAVTVFGGFLAALRPKRGATPMTDTAWTVLGVLWIGGGAAGAIAIMVLEDGIFLLIGFALSVAADDIAAYFVGTRLGRHKMAPSISPAKSWEGFAAGLAGALLGALGFFVLGHGIDLIHGLGLGLLIGLLAPVGDLIESMAKREVGLKDSGTLLPGHGGVLDRLDAIVFCAPFVFLYLRAIGL